MEKKLKGNTWFEKGNSLFKAERYEEALRCYDKALELNPSLVQAWNNKGYSLNRLGRNEEAIRCCDQALGLDPRHASAWYTKASAEDELGHSKEAARSYRQFLTVATDQYTQQIEHARQRIRELLSDYHVTEERENDDSSPGMEKVTPSIPYNSPSPLQDRLQKPSDVTISTQLIETKVVGVIDETLQAVVAELQAGEEVLLLFVRDIIDQPTIRVIRKNGQQIGFLSNDLVAKLATRFVFYGGVVKANVAAILGDNYSDSKLGVTIKFYPPMGRDPSPDDPRFDPEHWFLPKGDMLGFIHIPAGKFIMGSDSKKDKDAQEEELPQHKLKLPAFWMAKYPVTVAQFWAFVDATEYDFGRGHNNPIVDHPVVRVSWYDALEYCKWLGKQLSAIGHQRSARAKTDDEKSFFQGLADGKLQVSLPSEAEWEKAARGTDGRIYPWQGAFDTDKANVSETSIGETSAVGCFPSGASPFGMLDMSGNVWEWTRSIWYGQFELMKGNVGKWTRSIRDEYPYEPDDGRENLSENITRVIRGGTFKLGSRFARCAYRHMNLPESENGTYGFRVVVTPAFLS